MSQYCIYLRKSRADVEAEAHGETETLARHEHILLEHAKRMKINITEIHREVVSGDTIAARPIMQQLLLEVEQGVWAGVLVVDVDRLARGDTIDQGIIAQTFKLSDTKIITPAKTYDPNNEFDEEYFEFGLFMSRREYKTINRRLQRGRIASVKEGKFVANQAPYGYQKKLLTQGKGQTLEPNPEESEIVKMIYQLYTRGEPEVDGTYRRIGVSLIARKLNSMGIRPRKTDAWVIPTIRDMLRNPVYAGKIRWNWRPTKKKVINGEIKIERRRMKKDDWLLVDGLHPAIVDQEIWDLAQQYMDQNPPHPGPTQYDIKNPLSGLIRCGVCGRKMVRRPYSNGHPDTLMCPVTSCNNISSQLAIVEERILKSLGLWLRDYKIEWGLDVEKQKDDNIISIKRKALSKAQAELRILECQVDKLHDLLEQGIYSIEMFLERSKILAEKIQNEQKNVETLKLGIKQEEIREHAKKSIIPNVEQVLEVYPQLSDARMKNDLLKGILEKVIYMKTKKNHWAYHQPDEFVLDLYPKMPI
ncbi:MAG: recombinase family protein [Clostridiales bacterium]|nr:recombinase family protein [Clostridiales bacterium]